METPGQTFSRLVTALEGVVAQEEFLLRSEDYPAMAAWQQRAVPLIDHLVELDLGAADAAMRARVVRLMARRASNQTLLATKIGEARAELNRLRDDEQRVARISPSYGRSPAAPVRQLSVSG